MKLEDQVCSLELAKKLKAFNVKQESYFCWVTGRREFSNDGHIDHLSNDDRHSDDESGFPTYSAFTVAELGEMLPHEINIPYKNGRKRNADHMFVVRRWSASKWTVRYWCNKYSDNPETTEATEADARAKMLIHLIEKGMVKP